MFLLKLTAGYTNQHEQETGVPKAPAPRWFLAQLILNRGTLRVGPFVHSVQYFTCGRRRRKERRKKN
jgi:hypothetical protein